MKESKPEFIQRIIREQLLQGKSKEQALVEAYSTWKKLDDYKQKDFTFITKINKKI